MNDSIDPQPPQLAMRFIRWLCADRFLEEVEGDLWEWYAELEEIHGKRKARFHFYRSLFSYLRPYFFRKRNLIPTIRLDMYKNYLTIALRYFYRRKTHSLINIFGLAVGIAACLLILQYVSYELSFDRFHSKADQLYRVVNHRFQNGKLIQKGTITYPTIGPTMEEEFPEVRSHTRIFPGGRSVVRSDEEIFDVEHSIHADNNFFKLFSYPLLAGDSDNLLVNDYKVVLSQRQADRIFGPQDGNYQTLIGRTIRIYRDEQPYEISGIMKNVPANSLLQFDMVISYQTFITQNGTDADNSWTWSDFHHFLELQPGTDAKALEAKFAAFSDRHFKGDQVSGSVEEFSLQPLKQAHLYSNFEYEIGQTSNGRLIWTLLIVAGLILVIAWLNYINLSTARAIERAREVGVRKVLGSTKGQLIQQFFTESVLLNMLGLGLAVVLIELFRPAFSTILNVDLSWISLLGLGNGGSIFPIVFTGVFLLGIFLSGAYPALVLSRHNLSAVLKTKFNSRGSGRWTGKALVVFQFMVSIVFIAGTLLVYQQIKYFQNKDLGINLEDMMVIRGPELTAWDSLFFENIQSFKSEMLKESSVMGVTMSARLPGDRLGRMFDLQREDASGEEKFVASFMPIDHEWTKNYQAKLLAGRYFRYTDHNIDWNALDKVLLNKSALELLEFESSEDALDKRVRFWDRNWQIVGVLDDFHQESLQVPIEPIIFFPAYGTFNFFSVKVDSQNSEKALAHAQASYEKIFPGNAFQHFYMEELYDEQYMSEYSFGKILGFFTFLAIVIACLGLFGLLSYAALIRTKELGVRKILGASTPSLFMLLIRDFARLLGIAFIISVPLAIYSMQQWLSRFEYHIDIQWWIFILAGLFTLLMALISVGFQSAKAASRNPVEALRYE